MLRRAIFQFAGLVLVVLSVPAQTRPGPDRLPLRSDDFDIRDSLRAPAATGAPDTAGSPVRRRAAFRDSRPLAPPLSARPDQVARQFLGSQIPDLAAAWASPADFTADTQPLPGGAAGITLRQRVRGIPVFGERHDVTVDSQGQVWAASIGAVVDGGAVFTTAPR